MKRLISVTIIITVLASLFTFAGAYEGSWAAKEISELYADGFVSGDENGNMNLGKNITRAEFIKVFNRVMGYKEKAEASFADVFSSDWYYEEFLIARKSGTVNGDEKGNANPGKAITREEAFKIISIGIKAEGGNEISFSDESDISPWALPHIKALYAKGIVKGYEDGTVRPGKNITREEAFYILCFVKRINNEKTENEEPVKEPVKTGNVNINSGSSSGRGNGGGGGGSSSGGGSASAVKVLPPVITLLDDDLILNWKRNGKASSFDIFVSDGVNTKELSADGDETSVSVKNIIGEICEADRGHEELDIKIWMTSTYGNITSKESGIAEITVKVSEMISSAELGLKSEYGVYGEKRGFFVIWENENVTKVTVKLPAEDKIIENPVSPLDITDYITDADFNYVVIATADEGKQMVNVNMSASYYEGGSGTEEDPYIISEGYHFANISKNMSAHYVQTEDIVLDPDFVTLSVKAETPFSGTYKTADGENKVITADIYGEDYASLFGKTDGAEISNITASGSIVSSGKYVGAIAGEIKNTTVTGCINEMSVKGDAGFTGGICGILLNGGVIESCENKGSVESDMQYVAGIAGSSEAGSSISSSVNNGNIASYMVSGSEYYVGGITGKSVVSLSDCINGENATVRGGNATGGIVGYFISSGGVISGCENRGTIEFSSNTALTNIGGIAGILRTGSISDCKNTVTGRIEVSSPSATLGLGLGGIAGQTYSGTAVSDCENNGSISCELTGKGAYAGGICGNAQGNVTACDNTSSEITALYGGGIVGRSGTGKISLCYNTGDIPGESSYIGGIVGRNDSATVTSCFNLGTVTGKNSAGLVCLNNAAAATLENSYTVVSSTVSNAVARTQNGKVSNVYYVLKSGASLLVTTQHGSEITSDELKAMPEGISEENGWAVLPVDDMNKYEYPQLTENLYYGE